MDTTSSRLDDLARTDPVVSPLARLRAEALRAAEPWESSVPPMDNARLEAGQPLLHGAVLLVDAAEAAGLLERLAKVARTATPNGGNGVGDIPDAVAVLQASVGQDARQLEELATRSGVEPPYLATLGQLLALPLLQACYRRAAPFLENLTWDQGYCPVCAGWPVLAEVRGVEMQRWLRCGRCGAGWRRPNFVCAFCGNNDYKTLGYLATEAARESRQAMTCESCRGYLKTVATQLPLDADELFLRDVETLELDIAALEKGYGRPESPEVRLDVKVVPM